jgi:c(7)-type cytochrome triheme protein
LNRHYILLIPSAFLALFVAGGVHGADRPPDPATLRLPAPIRFDTSKDAPTPVVFRHETHTHPQRLQCTGCHPAQYRMLKPERRVTHAEMDAGRSCGTCHDGKKTFATSDTDKCDSCHKGDLP